MSFKQKGKMMIYTGMDKKSFDDIYGEVAQEAKTIRFWKGPKRTVNRLRKHIPGLIRCL